MIDFVNLEKHREYAPWKTFGMVEQDLILSKAIICLFNNDIVQNALLFRGGTALNKLFLKPPAR